jgi:anti-sigma factor RsiW
MGNDAQLVALLDGELDEETGSRLLARIASDENLRNRYDALREAGSWLASAFDWLLEEAPLSRLRTALQRERPGREAWPPLARVPFRAMAFAVALCIVAAGVGAWLALNSTTSSSKEDWRSGRGYLVIGRIPEERALELTQRVAA